MTTSTRYSMTWTEVITIVAIAAILVALLMAPGNSAGSGSFELQIDVSGPVSAQSSIRFAKVYRERLAEGKVEVADLDWWSADKVTFPFTMTVMYDTYSRFNAFSERSWVVCLDGLLVDYCNGTTPPLFRLISFERQRGQELVDVIIPLEPPSDTEAWSKP